MNEPELEAAVRGIRRYFTLHGGGVGTTWTQE